MLIPHPLDWEPPLVQAKWYRTTHRAPWPGWGIVLHTTEGGGGSRAAENGANYNANRTSMVSCQTLVDTDSCVQSVKDADVCFSAGYPANDMYWHLEICGFARWTKAEWFDKANVSLDLIAWRIASWVHKNPEIPIQFLYAEQLAAKYVKGITTHAEITRASNPQTPLGYVDGPYFQEGCSVNDHTDPGYGFYPPRPGDSWSGYPIEYVFNTAKSYLAAPGPVPPPHSPFPPQEDDMSIKNPFVRLKGKTATWHSNGVMRSWVQTPLNLRQQLYEAGRIDDNGFNNLTDAQLRAAPYVTEVGDLGGYGAIVGTDPGNI